MATVATLQLPRGLSIEGSFLKAVEKSLKNKGLYSKYEEWQINGVLTHPTEHVFVHPSSRLSTTHAQDERFATSAYQAQCHIRVPYHAQFYHVLVTNIALLL